ncbi:MAG TPA: hypothetical protein VJ719_08070 [Chthoniobacterales bacterium]|nr:hypothetical protein [Chthoniobacterales bacterium]
MKKPSVTKQDALETWMADEIANLAGTLPPAKVDLLFLDAQMTDLETQCAIRQNRMDHQLSQSKDIRTLRASGFYY